MPDRSEVEAVPREFVPALRAAAIRRSEARDSLGWVVSLPQRPDLFYVGGHSCHRRGFLLSCGWRRRVDLVFETRMKTPPNKPAAPNPAIASRLHVGHHWRGVGEPER